MGSAFSLKFGPATAGLRILVASPRHDEAAELARGLMADGHNVLAVTEPTELVFMMEVVDMRLGPMPDLIVLDAAMKTAIDGRLARAPMFVVLDVESTELAQQATLLDVLDLRNATVFRKPLDLDDLRTAAMNLDAWRTARTRVRRFAPLAEPRGAR